MSVIGQPQKLLNIYAAEESSLATAIDAFLYKRNSVRLGAAVRQIAVRSETRGMVAFFINSDLSGLKQHFHVASRLTLMSSELDGGSDLCSGWPILYALLSDSPSVIDAVSDAVTPSLRKNREDPRAASYIVHMWQLVIQRNDEALRAKLHDLGKSGPKEFREKVPQGKDFFSLLLAKDEPGLEKLIHCHAHRKDNNPLTEDFLSFDAVLEAKLCWRRGISVQIDHPKVPMGLMPIQPLSSYDDEYEFLRPDWVPPPQGLVGKIKRWLA